MAISLCLGPILVLGGLLLLNTLYAADALGLQAQAQLVQQPQTYLFPILRYGPNNQKRDLRHTLALAKALGTGIILPGIHKHYKDLALLKSETLKGDGKGMCFAERKRGFMEFHEILDRASLDSWLPVASVAELRAQGWDGQLDAVIYQSGWWERGERDISKSFTAHGLNVGPSTALIKVPGFLNCRQTELAAVRQKISGYRYVGVLFVVLSDRERPHISAEPMKPPANACKRIIYEANRLLRPAAWLDQLASRYIQAHIGQGQSYLAMHIRPYPDTCMEKWKHGQLDDPERLLRACIPELSNLHQRLGPCAKHLMALHQLTRVFVMAHPCLHTMLRQLFQQEGVEPLFLDSASVTELAGCRDNSATFLALVEEQLAVHAHTFLGTATSSITQTIVYQRLGVGNMRNVYFEALQCGPAAPRSAKNSPFRVWARA